jgi:hypothetical protein
VSRRANYEILSTSPDVVIRDIGPWDKFLTVTNAAESVVAELVVDKVLKEGQRLFSYDSNGEIGEILVKYGKFVGFAPFSQPEPFNFDGRAHNHKGPSSPMK